MSAIDRDTEVPVDSCMWNYLRMATLERSFESNAWNINECFKIDIFKQ
jgi:hypothetical protein